MKKNQGFLRKARLGLCLFCAIGLSGCSVSRPVASYRTYRVTITVMPGYDFAELTGNTDRIIFPPVISIINQPEHRVFKMRLASEDELMEFRNRLNASGLIVEEMVPVDD